jgi:hypothetical protein
MATVAFALSQTGLPNLAAMARKRVRLDSERVEQVYFSGFGPQGPDPWPRPPELLPEPNLRVEKRVRPLLTIVVANVPENVARVAIDRAQRLNLSLRQYWRVVLEHAVRYREWYEDLEVRRYPLKRGYLKVVRVPIRDKRFASELLYWRRYGLESDSEVALEILARHLAIASW